MGHIRSLLNAYVQRITLLWFTHLIIFRNIKVYKNFVDHFVQNILFFFKTSKFEIDHFWITFMQRFRKKLFFFCRIYLRNLGTEFYSTEYKLLNRHSISSILIV